MFNIHVSNVFVAVASKLIPGSLQLTPPLSAAQVRNQTLEKEAAALRDEVADKDKQTAELESLVSSQQQVLL